MSDRILYTYIYIYIVHNGNYFLRMDPERSKISSTQTGIALRCPSSLKSCRSSRNSRFFLAPSESRFLDESSGLFWNPVSLIPNPQNLNPMFPKPKTYRSAPLNLHKLIFRTPTKALLLAVRRFKSCSSVSGQKTSELETKIM